MTRLSIPAAALAMVGLFAMEADAQRSRSAVDERKTSRTFPCWSDDSYEPNDTFATATNLSGIRLPKTFSSCPNDVDFFAIELSRGDILQVHAEFFHGEGDVDIAIHSPGASGASSASNSDDEFVRYIAREDGTHHVSIKLYSDLGIVEGNTYKLDVDVERARSLVAPGHNHTCFLRDGSLQCWGDDVPVPTGLFPFARVAAGMGSTCALDTTGTIRCEKKGPGDYFGQAPAVKSIWGGFTDVSARSFSACGLTSHGLISCWGFTPGATWSSAASAYVGGESPPSGTFKQVSVGDGHVCALGVDGDVACWGHDTYGQAPDVVAGPFASVSAGSLSTCAIRTDGSLQCWGKTIATAPTGPFRQVSLGSNNACALRSNGDTVCWGTDIYGAATPVHADKLHDSIAFGGLHACSTIPNGFVDCWGFDYSGQASVPKPEYATLSETGIDNAEVEWFKPNFALWSDNADKDRFVYLPPGAVIDTSHMDEWQVPVGTKVWKEFAFGFDVVETRLIERYGYGDDDYLMMAYDWNDEGTEALPVPEGTPGAYGGHDIPSVADCGVCHDRNPAKVLGFSAIQLSHNGSGVTMSSLIAGDRISDPNANGYNVETYEVPGSSQPTSGGYTAADAIGYLHANCGHCHNPSSDLTWTGMNMWLSVEDETVFESGAYATTVGEPMLNTSFGYDTRIVAGNPNESGIVFRMGSRTAGEQMPPIATREVDEFGMNIIDAWISAMQ